MKVFDKLEEWVGGTLFVIMFIVLVMQITARQVLGTPLMWSEELSSLIFTYVGMLGISMGIRSQQHVLIDFLFTRFSPKVLGTPLMWSEELSSLIFTYVGMLGISMGIRSQQHVLIDFLFTRFSPKVQKVVFTLTQMIIFVCIIFMGYLGNLLYQKKWIFDLVSLKISAGWMYLALPIVSILMMVRFFQAYTANYDTKRVLISPNVF